MSRGKRSNTRVSNASNGSGAVERVAAEKEEKRMIMSSSFQGPLPPPNLLANYDDVVPGLASKIANWTTDQTDHRQSMESRAMAIDEKLSTWFIVETLLGQLFAFCIAIGVLGCSVYLALHDRDGVAIALGTIGFGSMVAAFLTGKRSRTASESSLQKQKK